MIVHIFEGENSSTLKRVIKSTTRNLLDRQSGVRVPLAVARELVSIILPVYNEAENLTVLLHALSQTLDTAGLNYNMVVVDDARTDETAPALREMTNLYLQAVRVRT